jgi:hypothetical protein
MLLLGGYISNFTRARYYFLCVEFSDFYVNQSLTGQTIAAWLLKRQLPSNPDDRGTTRKTITLLTTAVKTCIRL